MRQIVSIGLIVFGLFIGAAGALQPADKQIKNAYQDLLRYQDQAARLTPSQKSSAKRIMKLVYLSRDRLAGSKNQSHESWKTVNAGYEALVAQLEAIAAITNTSCLGMRTLWCTRQRSPTRIPRSRTLGNSAFPCFPTARCSGN